MAAWKASDGSAARGLFFGCVAAWASLGLVFPRWVALECSSSSNSSATITVTTTSGSSIGRSGSGEKRRLKFKLLSQLVALSPIARSSRFLESQSGWQVRTLSLTLSRTHSHTPAHKIVTEIVFFSPSGFCGREKGESETGPDVGTGERGSEKPGTLSLPFSFSLTLSLCCCCRCCCYPSVPQKAKSNRDQQNQFMKQESWKIYFYLLFRETRSVAKSPPQVRETARPAVLVSYISATIFHLFCVARMKRSECRRRRHRDSSLE